MNIFTMLFRYFTRRHLLTLVLPLCMTFLVLYTLLPSNPVTRRKYMHLSQTNNLMDEQEQNPQQPQQQHQQQINQKFSIRYCNPVGIKHKFSPVVENQSIACRPHIASETACNLAKELYAPNKKYQSCPYSRPVHICEIFEVKSSPNAEFEYKCSLSECRKNKRDNVIIWYFSAKSGKLGKQDLYTSHQKLEEALLHLSKASAISGYHFLILECSQTLEYKRKDYDIIAQFLLLPPFTGSKRTEKDGAKRKLPPSIVENTIVDENQQININIILLDSISRSHFYRSLPVTLATFNAINEDKNSESEILDFQSFQSVEGHTAENLHALFTGTLYPKHFNGNDRETSAAGIGELFKRFSSKGYKTFYQDDLCYEEYWGVRLELGSPSSFSGFKQKLQQNFINHTGLTFSSCKILSTNNVTNPFNGPEGRPVCFNGRNVDAYYLDFLHLYHELSSRRNDKLLSFTALNVAHDHTGVRIQSIDHELSEFVRKISKSKNTLTLLLADHGNTYTHYTHAVMEGRFEQYHPSFFMVIPDNVNKKLGEKIMTNLRSNQLKLFTIMHLHEALKHIPEKPIESGIFASISPSRTCDELELRLPNLCVCEGWDAETLNNTRQVGMLDFAVGQLNNKLQEHQKSMLKVLHLPKCKKLIPISFTNVRERNHGKFLITSLDFTTRSGKGASQSYDVFHVQIQSMIKIDASSRQMKFLSFDRISKYGPYRACADDNINMRLCVCDLDKPKRNLSMKEFVRKQLVNHATHTKYILRMINGTKSTECVLLRIFSYPEKSSEGNVYSASYEVANVCPQTFKVTLDLTLDNMLATTTKPFFKTLLAYGSSYLGSVIRAVPYWDSKVTSIEFKVEAL